MDPVSPYPPDSVGALMAPPIGVLPESLPLRTAIEELRRLSAVGQVTYLYAVGPDGRLTGAVVLKDLFLNPPERTLAEIAIRPPFFLTPEMPLLDAMRATVSRHYPVYPVCDAERRVVGLVRGHVLFERQAVVISAQAGRMVGVPAKETLVTPWWDSLRFRQPWLQLNLLLALLSAVVIGCFQNVISELVVLAMFFPVVAAQARNSGAQTMAITLRGMATGSWAERNLARVLGKEVALGLFNGLLVGIVSGAVITLVAPGAAAETWKLGGVMLVSMGVSCGLSGLFGVLIPLGLRWLGTDPALAASILLTTIATLLSQGIFLGLAAWVTRG